MSLPRRSRPSSSASQKARTSQVAKISRLSLSPRTSQNKTTEKRLQVAYFKEVLNEAGVVLRYDELSHYIKQEQSLVIRDINKELQSHISYPSNVAEFVAGLKSLCQWDVHLQKLLLPCELRKTDMPVNESVVKQFSVVRILLGIPSVQKEVVNVMLEYAALIVCDDDSESTSKLRMILNPLRFLSYISDTNALVTRVLDLLDASQYLAKCEILDMMPEIIPDCEFEKTALHLSKLLEDNIELSAAIINCLNGLNLNADLTSEIQQQIMSLLSTTDVTKTFSILFEFLVTNNKNLQEVLLKCRSILNSIFESDDDDDKVLVFGHLCTIVFKERTVYEGWLNVLSNIRVVAEFKPADLIVLFYLHSVNASRKSTVEVLIKKRIMNGSIKIDLLEKLFKCMVSQILKDCLKPIMHTADYLLKYNNENILTEFASETYRLLFNHKLVDQVERQDIIHNLLSQINSDRKGGSVLNIFLTFLNDDFDKLHQHSVSLMGLLEKLDCVNLKDVKNIFDILCTLTCGEKANQSMSGLGDELHMIIRKNLNSAKKFTKSCGIVAAVAMAKTLIITTGEQSETTLEDSLAITDIEDVNAKTAAALLETISTHTSGTPDSLGLYYDQLAAVLVSSTNLNNQFLIWLYQIVTSNFQTVFVTETFPDRINDIQVSAQYSLNASEEIESQIAVNIAELTINPGSTSILVLAPLFRLLQLVHLHQHNGDLSSIDALLGCSVLLPSLDDLDSYDTLQLKHVADCIFHCINWFRELISAFVKQTSRKLRKKVLERIKGVTELEELLQKCISNIPDHCLPQSYFDHMSQTSSKRQLSPATSNKLSRPKKKAKTSETATQNADDTIPTTSAPVAQGKPTSKKLKSSKNVKLEFREVNIDVILLFKYPLKFEALNVSVSSPATTLSVLQLKFLMEEFVVKLSGTSNNTHSTNLITDCSLLITAIQKHLNAITLNFDEILKEADGCLDAKQLFTNEANNLKIVFMLIMKAYSLLFGWLGFQSVKNNSLLRGCLRALRSAEHQSQMLSTKALVADAVDRFVGHVDHCMYLPAAVCLIQTVQALQLVQRETQPETKKKIATLGGKLLKKDWYNLEGERESGKNAHLNIDVLIKAYLCSANVRIIHGLVGTLCDQATELNSKEDKLGMFGSIDKTNFYLFYRCLCVKLLEAVRIEIAGLTNNQHLDVWYTVATTMAGLMRIVKAQETKSNLISFLKNSVGILKVFLYSGIPILEIMLRSKPDKVVEIFKTMQTSTRFLHYLCCHSKYKKDTSLVAFVPQFRLTLESLVYRVKAALVANGCAAAFWMGNLRNRDLYGEDISSQSTVQSDESRNSDDELPPDDDEDDENVEKDRQEDEMASSELESTASDIF